MWLGKYLALDSTCGCRLSSTSNSIKLWLVREISRFLQTQPACFALFVYQSCNAM